MPRNAIAYDEDFYAWTEEQARLLRAGEFSQVDVENVAEELESMGRSDRRALDSHLVVLLMHLLKWQIQVLHRSPGWAGTIREQRERIEDLLQESPSLRQHIAQIRPPLYSRARRAAANETGLALKSFPQACPFTPEQVLSEEFLPEG
jgi:hypothetical protein